MSERISDTTLSKWRSLVKKLENATNHGKIDWDSGVLPEELITTVGEITISLRQTRGEYIITIRDDFGQVIDSFNDEQLGVTSDGSPAHAALEVLHHTIRRKITGADKIIDSILERLTELDDEIPF